MQDGPSSSGSRASRSYPVHRGGRNRTRTSGAASVQVFDAAVAKAYGGQRKIAWMEVLAGEKAFNLDRRLAARRHARRLPRVPGRHQGPADHAGRWRHPLAERRAAADPRPLHVPAPGAVVRGRALAGQAPELTDMVIFRENTEDIYAGIEFENGTPECRQVQGDVRRGLPGPHSRRSASRDSRHRHQAGLQGRHGASSEGGDPVRDRQRPRLGDACPQGQHHEVHRGRLPRLGLRSAREGGVRRASRLDGPVVYRCKAAAPKQKAASKILVIKDVIADAMLQQILTRPAEYRRDRHAEPQRRLHLRRPGRAASAASASRRAATSTTTPATRSSRPRTARRRSTLARTR